MAVGGEPYVARFAVDLHKAVVRGGVVPPALNDLHGLAGIVAHRRKLVVVSQREWVADDFEIQTKELVRDLIEFVGERVRWQRCAEKLRCHPGVADEYAVAASGTFAP